MEQDLQGNIERFTLPEIFQLVSSGRKTGTLGIQCNDDIVMVYFKDGSVVYGYGPRKTHHLGRMLVDRHRITPRQLDEAIKEQSDESSGGRRLGQILIDKTYIDRKDLEDVIRRQVEELIYSLMSWDHGSFKFYENQFPTREEVTIKLSTENVVLEGLRRLDEFTRAKDFLPDLTTVFALVPAQPGQIRDISLEPEEWNILALIDGHRSIEKIVSISPLEPAGTLRRLTSLKLAGLIAPVGENRENPDKLDAMIDNLGGLIKEYLGENTDSDTAKLSEDKS